MTAAELVIFNRNAELSCPVLVLIKNCAELSCPASNSSKTELSCAVLYPVLFEFPAKLS